MSGKKGVKSIKTSDLQYAILKSIQVAGFLTVAILAPNALQMFKLFGKKPPQRRQREMISRSYRRLIKRGYLYLDSDNKIRTTKLGQEKLIELELKDYKFKKPWRWNGKWHILIFDIPEKKRKVRDQIRLTLSTVGFVQLQQSVWVYPYECQDFITLLKTDFEVGKDVLYIVAKSIENEQKLKDIFKLES